MDAKTFAVRPAPGLDAIAPYAVPRHPAPIDLHLAGNEGAVPPEAVVRALARSVATVRSYPDAGRLEARLAARLGVAADRVLVTAGADDALARVVRAVAGAGAEVVLPSPTFEMLPRYVRLAGADVVEVPWAEGDFPVDGVVARVGPRTAAVVVVSPNNPTGAAASPEALARLLDGVRDRLVVVDLAYGEYADADLRGVALARENVLVTGTLSKAWGLAGLRVGFAAGPTELVRWMRAVGQPYAVAGPSLAAADAALDLEAEFVPQHLARVRDERERLVDLLAALGGRPRRSQANFVLVEHPEVAWIADGLAGLGIAVRRFPGRPGLERALRITCPASEVGFARLADGLGATLDPEALVVDRAVLGGGASPERLERLERRLRVPVVVLDGGVAPDGERVRGALAALGLRRAWLAASTPEGLRAARSAGAVPLGIEPRGAGAGGDPLGAAGAARVLRSLEAVAEVRT